MSMTKDEMRMICLLYFQHKCLLETECYITFQVTEEMMKILVSLCICKVIEPRYHASGAPFYFVTAKGIEIMNRDIEAVNLHKQEFISFAKSVIATAKEATL